MMPPEDPYSGDINSSGPITRNSTASPSRNIINRSPGDNSHIRAFDLEKQGQDSRRISTTERTEAHDHDADNNIVSGCPTSRSFLQKPVRRVTLKFEDVVYKIKLNTKIVSCWRPSKPTSTANSSPKKERQAVEKTILNGVTGMVCPGEILAMLGPSGSGKTTLLSAVGGRLEGKVSGSILFNGQRFGKSMKRKTGFVTQDDVLYPHLTVRETLVYAALLRLPRALSRQEKREHVDAIIGELGLTRCRNTIIGGPLLRGVSGGERKRVSIGQEMLTNPSLLLLDEPTSGLDSTTAQRIIVTLRNLARGGRTIITTIHQPSSRLYYMFHKVILLSEGNLIYYGEASATMDYFSSIGFAPSYSMNPADFMLDLANGIAPDMKSEDDTIEQAELNGRKELEDQKNVRQNLILQYKKNLACKIKAELHNVDDYPNGEKQPRSNCENNEWATSWWEQFSVLLRRSLKERKHESFGGLRIFQVLTVSTLAGLLWWQSKVSHIQDQVGLLFFFSIFWGFFPLFNAVFTFPQESSMLIKERSSGMYRLSSYFVARTVGDLPMELILPTVFVCITYWMGGLREDARSFVLTLLIILYNVLVSQGLGLAMGAVLMDVKQATTLSSVTMLTFLLVGGYYIHTIPAFIAWLKYFSFSYYCYKLLIGVQFSAEETYECAAGRTCLVADYPAIRATGLGDHTIDVIALAVMLVGYRLLAYAALRRVKPTGSC
uniref:TSA: Wollemia nobilis Ref_Wollemi_Transcript_15471_2810 transcribed RNA sequence n=1 Tax=Wollemia nobilis TaxID=56998 RepID=A0A0C9S664_9CONI